MTYRIDKRQLAVAAAVLGGVALLLVIWFARGNQAKAGGSVPARDMAGLARAGTRLANTPAVLKTFPADMVPAAGTAHLLTSQGDVSVYAWPHGANVVCVAHSGGGAGASTTSTACP